MAQHEIRVEITADGSKAIACLNRISGPVDVELNEKTPVSSCSTVTARSRAS